MDEYYDTLVGFVDGYEYSQLLSVLYSYNYLVTNSLDSNRVSKAYELRNKLGFDDEYPVTVFELLVSLAVECEEEIMSNPDKGDRTVSWFWLFLQNAGLTLYSDKYLKQNKHDYAKIELWIATFNSRTYKRDGKDYILPIHKSRKDLRKYDLWTQLNWFINENFDTDF